MYDVFRQMRRRNLRSTLIDLGLRCHCSLRHFHAEDCVDEHTRVQAEPGGDRGKHSGDAEIKPIDRGETTSRARDHAYRIGVHRGDGAARVQSDVEEREAQPEQEIGRADDAQVEGAETRDLGIVAKKADPQARLERYD